VDAIHLPPGLTLPSAYGAPAQPLQAGQVIQALVLERIENDIFRLQLPQAVIDVRSSVPLTPGGTITLVVKGIGPSARFAVYTDAPSAASVTSLAGRTPIGEAIVVARGSGQGVGAARNSVSALPPEEASATPLPVTRPSATPIQSLTPQQAVTEAIRTAAPRQAGLSPLFADLAQVVQAANGVQGFEPVRQAAADVLSLRVLLDGQLTANDVKQALVRSGVLFEPHLAAGGSPTPTKDLKAALLVLRQALNSWSARAATAAHPTQSPQSSSDAEVRHVANILAGLPDERPQRAPMSAEEAAGLAKSLATALLKRDAAAVPTTQPNVLPPPYRGAPPAAQAVAAPSIAPGAPPHEIAGKLIAEADGALARTTLLQVASLPEQTNQPRTEATQRWNFEIPFATAHGTAVAQFEISRDGRTLRADPHAHTWRARFSLDVEPMGPVHALIALTGSRTSVTLWAERASTAARLDENAAMLSEALRAAALDPADFSARLGAPPVARQAEPGRFMDRAS